MDSLLEHAADAESLAVLSRFRLDFHACLTARGDELADAVLCADGPVRTLAGLSLAPEHRRGHLRSADVRLVGLIGESPEDLLPADPVLGEVDRNRQVAVGLSWRELAEGAVRPGSVVVLEVLGQHLARVLLVDDQQPVEKLPT
jgi:hypothetical protein